MCNLSYPSVSVKKESLDRFKTSLPPLPPFLSRFSSLVLHLITLFFDNSNLSSDHSLSPREDQRKHFHTSCSKCFGSTCCPHFSEIHSDSSSHLILPYREGFLRFHRPLSMSAVASEDIRKFCVYCQAETHTCWGNPEFLLPPQKLSFQQILSVKWGQ